MKKKNIIIGTIIFSGLSILIYLRKKMNSNLQGNLSNNEKNIKELKKIENNSNKIDTSENEIILREKNTKNTSYSSFFNCNILNEYIQDVNTFLSLEGEDSLKYIKNYIFSESGDFNYDMLKQLLTERYQNISNIMNSELFSPSIASFPLERYLSEIEILKNSDNISAKVEGILSYWGSINISLGADKLLD